MSETVELLQALIRNACVNDGSPASGNESRNADTIAAYLDGAGMDVERFEEIPGRASLVGRIEGSDPSAPTLMLMGHTDVVPANPDGWTRDPFGGELKDGYVWGRGAVDMLNLTASMAVAIRGLLKAGVRPRGSLVYFAVADEEAGGGHGAGWLMAQRPEVLQADYVLTEAGGFRLPFAGGERPRLPVLVAEKGLFWGRLVVHGTPGHGSRPFRTDNALVKAAEVVRRLAAYRPAPRISEQWRRFIAALDLPAEIASALTDPQRVTEACADAEDVELARLLHASTHTTVSPNMARGGVKTNVIPDRVEISVDIRTLPGQTAADVRAVFADALGELWDESELIVEDEHEATESPAGTPLWDVLERVSSALVPGAMLVPMLMTGGTDARFFRDAGARAAYGYSLFSDRIPYDEYASMFHGDDERVDIESLALTTSLWEAVARESLEGR